MQDEVWLCIEWWRNWKTFGVLPYGSDDILDEPAYVMEALQICQNEVDEFEYKKNKELQDEIKKSKNSGPKR